MSMNPDAQPRARREWRSWMRGNVHTLRTEGAGAERDAAAIGVGVFIGCSPFYGAHLLLCWVAGALFGLNRLKVYLAANISNPLTAPLVILAELQAGSWVRRGQLHALTLDTIRTTDPWLFGLDLLIGSAVVGAALGAAAAAATYAAARRSRLESGFSALVSRAADRYVATSITASEFARGKLRGDPVYREVLYRGLLPGGGTLIDVGCGQGLMLALLAEAARAADAGAWPARAGPAPRFDRLVGIETRPGVAGLARLALDPDALIINADARTVAPQRCHVVLLFDVLHMMPQDEQDALIARFAARLDAGGAMLVREADASAGWRFAVVRLGNRLKALAFLRWRQRFHFSTAAGWASRFSLHGFEVEILPMSHGTPFGNVLFKLTPQPRPSYESRCASQYR